MQAHVDDRRQQEGEEEDQDSPREMTPSRGKSGNHEALEEDETQEGQDSREGGEKEEDVSHEETLLNFVMNAKDQEVEERI